MAHGPCRDPALRRPRAPLLDSARSDLQALRPPPELEDEVTSWLQAIEDERDALSNLRRAAADKDAAKARAIGVQGAVIEQRARTRARGSAGRSASACGAA